MVCQSHPKRVSDGAWRIVRLNFCLLMVAVGDAGFANARRPMLLLGTLLRFEASIRRGSANDRVSAHGA